MKVIGIAGGSGTGKSTVAYALVDTKPDIFEVLNLDDYHRLSSEPKLPMMAGMINWDHPDIINSDALITDLNKLKYGQPVTINVWAHRSNVDYAKTHERIVRTITPKPVLIVEGYLALCNPDLFKLFDKSYYFDLDNETRKVRRDKNELFADASYEAKVLAPMHQKYVEPSKQNADEIINVAGMSIEQIKQKILQDLE